jgi:hypothetical protein
VDRRRFQNLEKARPERRHPETHAEDPLSAVRLERVEADVSPAAPGEESETPQTGLARERFEEPPIPLATVAPDEPLFHRCHVCGADNQRSDEVCQHCSASLRTAAQEAFDAKLLEKEHEEQRHERDREWQREHERTAALLNPQQQADLGKAFSELIAEERGDGRPLALRLLLWLPNPWRWVFGGVIALGYYGLYRATERTNGWVWVWIVVGLVTLVLFTPPRAWTQTVDRNRWF